MPLDWAGVAGLQQAFHDLVAAPLMAWKVSLGAGAGLSPPLTPRAGTQRSVRFLVQREKVLDALEFRREAGTAIEPIHGAVKVRMGATETLRHHIRIVQGGERLPGMVRASIENRLRMRFEFRQIR